MYKTQKEVNLSKQIFLGKLSHLATSQYVISCNGYGYAFWGVQLSHLQNWPLLITKNVLILQLVTVVENFKQNQCWQSVHTPYLEQVIFSIYENINSCFNTMWQSVQNVQTEQTSL